MCCAWQALASWFLGYPDQACAHAEAGIEAASHSNHAGDMGVAVIMSSWVRLLRKEYALTIEKADQARQFNADRGFAFHVAVCEMLLGAAQIARTQDRNGLHRLKTGIGNVAATGAGIFQAGFTTLLGAGYGIIGAPEKGLDILADAEIMIDQSGERWQEAELHRHKAELLQAIGRPHKEVEDSLQRSLEIARRQNAKSLELRTSSILARLWHTDGNKNKARDLLQPVYDWFAEGLDTPDLTEAKQLLDALS
jgi:predicted ATPase